MLLSPGQVGIVLNCEWFQPEDEAKQSDIEAARRGMEFYVGWFAHPIFINGDYPEVMKTYIMDASLEHGRTQSRLPEFTQEEKNWIKGQAVTTENSKS